MNDEEPKVLRLEPEEIFKAVTFLMVTNNENSVEAAVFFNGKIYKVKVLLEEVVE